LRCAIYARCSLETKDQNPDLQVSRIKSFVSLKGWEITEEIVDHGYTGSNDNRPGFHKLMDLARSKQIDAIIITKFDRLFRSLKMLLSTLDELNQLGIVFVAVDDNIDYSSASGRLMLQILGSLAEFYNALLRERTCQGLDYARNVKGIRLGAPERFNKDLIRQLGKQGKSYSEIAQLMKCSKSTVGQVLQRRVRKWKK
jgi:DNA invertase Pin-like site-specific DNA recombinase